MKSMILFLFIASFLSGCASIFHGTKQSVTFDSAPQGAEVFIDGTSRGKTPLTVKLGKNDYETVMIKKDGYDTIVRPLETSYDAIALLNIFWDLSTTDFLTGAAYEYEPNSYYFNLSKKTAENKNPWLYNNGKLDRDIPSEITSFVLMYFSELKRERSANASEYTDVLVSLMKRNSGKSELELKKDLQKTISKTENAIQLLKKLRNST